MPLQCVKGCITNEYNIYIIFLPKNLDVALAMISRGLRLLKTLMPEILIVHFVSHFFQILHVGPAV